MEDDSNDINSDYNDNGRSDNGNDGRNDKASHQRFGKWLKFKRFAIMSNSSVS